MKLSDEAQAGVPHAGAAGASEERATDGARPGLIEVLFQFGEEALASANGLIEVKADRVRLSVRRTIVKVALGVAAGVCAVLWLGAAALATLRGLCGGFTALWGGREWLGELCGGVLALTLAAVSASLIVRLSTRRELIRLEAKYERIRNKSGASHEREDPAQNAGAAARSRGSVGTPAPQPSGAPHG